MADELGKEGRRRELREFVVRTANVGPQAVLDRSAATALRAFEEAGVAALLLKGPVLARRLYRAGEHRSYGDIDVLVKLSHLEQARAALTTLGYDNASTRYAGVDDFLGVLNAEAWADQNGCCLDLHWRLAGWELAAEQTWELLYGERATIEVGGHRASALGADALALHVATHAAQHGPGDVKAMGDLARAVDRWPAAQWQRAADLAARVMATDAMSAGLRLLPAGAALAQRLGLPAGTATSWAIRHRATRPRGTFHLRALVETRGWRARGEILRRSLLPTPAWIAAQSPSARRSAPALLAAYARHLMRAPLWALRAWRYDRRVRAAARRSGRSEG